MNIVKVSLAAAALFAGSLPGITHACGGFFCQLVPINQAAEQIVFRQDGDQVTAMVQIQFAGNAEDFSWVVPVPSIPEFEIGSNRAFTDLESATRPDFNLIETGSACFAPEFDVPLASVADSAAEGGDTDDGAVIVESVQDVGGYEVSVISGDNAEAVTQWLIDNDYDLTQQGRDLLAPYVEEGMKFVAARLQQNRGLGSIQPLIMKYQSDKPVVPIRLTAVAALEDMGVIVWLLGDARAVPENYLHVIPNYTRLDWFNGPFNAYGSYQQLITDAMDEAGGQGFATDYAGRFSDLSDQLTQVADLEETLSRFADSPDTEFLALVQNAFFNDAIVQETIAASLPLRDDQSPFLLSDQNFLASNFTAAELSAARNTVDAVIRAEIIAPLQLSLDVLAGDRYMTRLYTTLSAEDMTLDPSFVFNSDMGDQQLSRNATLDINCIDDLDHWTLTLGEGTGRNGEVVVDTINPVPFAPLPITQEAGFRFEETAAAGQPVVTEQRDFAVASLGSPGPGISNGGGSVDGETTTGNGTTTDGGMVDSGGSGGGGFGASVLMLMLISLLRRR